MKALFFNLIVPVFKNSGPNKTLRAVLFIVALGLGFSSCSSLEMQRKQSCQNMNTYKKGLKEASQGKKNLFRGYQQQCQKYGISLNKEQFEKGRKEGLKVFCVKDRGYNYGLYGKTYNNICPKDLENLFLTGYKEGASQCLLDKGKSDALYGKKSSFDKASCIKPEGNPNEKQYNKGYQAGLKEFCVQKKGYEWGENNKNYQKTCSGKREANFLVGYKKGIKKCLYDIGYSSAFGGGKNRFPNKNQKSYSTKLSCPELKGVSPSLEYNKGYSAGLNAFCTQAKGYQFGLEGYTYKSTCPKSSEANFYKGWTKGMKEYNEKKAREEALELERQRIRVERERMRREASAREEALELQREQIENQEEVLRLQKLQTFGYKPCKYSSDCGSKQYCRYDYSVKERVCKD